MERSPMPKLTYAVEQRLRLVDFLLDSFGFVQRKHLMDYFGISKPCASLDFAKYEKMAPDNMHYDLRKKCWVAAEGFQRVFP